jgi:WD40 repeat protein
LASVDSFDRQQIRRIRETPSRTALRDAVKTFGQGEPWLLFVDQFEQIFTRTTNQAKRAAFLDAIAALARSEHPNVCLVLAMRDDFFPQLRDYPDLFPLTDRHCFRVAALSREALQEVIERPAAEHGVAFQPGLADKIIEAVDRQPGALPLLQYSLDALWKADDPSDRLLNDATYDLLGGVSGSLGRRLQNLYDQQEPTGQDQFRWMMLKLVTYDESGLGSSVVSRLAPKSEFVGKQGELLEPLLAQGLVVSSGTSTPSVQLGHERIIDAWPAFTDWTQQYREANTLRQKLTKAASDWAELRSQGEYQRANRALWQGSQLEKALELKKRGDFEELGGLSADENGFLDASYRSSRRMIRRLWGAVGVALVLAAIGWWNYRQAELNAYQAEKNAYQAEQNASEAKQNARDANRQRSNASWQLGVIARKQGNDFKAAFHFLYAAQASEQAGEAADRPQQRSFEFAAQEASSGLLRLFPLDDYYVSGAKLTLDESRVLAWGGSTEAGEVKLWDVTQAEPLQAWQHEGWVYGAVFSRDESRVLAWSDDGAVKLWDVTKTEPLQTWQHQGLVFGAVFSRDESRVLAWSNYGEVKLWDVAQAEPLQAWQHQGPVFGAVFSRDESRVLSWGGRDGVVKLWDVTQAEPLQVWQHQGSINGAVFSRDESRVLAWSRDGVVKLWDLMKAEPLQAWQHQGQVNGAVFSRDESRVLSWSDDGVVKLWDVTQAKPLQAWQHQGSVNGAVFSRDESRVLAWTGEFKELRTRGELGEVKLWDVMKTEPLQAWQHQGSVNGAVFSRDESRVLAWSRDGAVKLWGVTHAEPLQAWQHQGPVKVAVFSRDESRVLAWSGEFKEPRTHSEPGEVKLWDVTKAEPLQTLQHQGPVFGAVFSHDESLVLSWSPDGAVKLWDVTQAEPLQAWQQEEIRGATLNRDESRVLAWSDDGEVKLWDVTKTEPLQAWQHQGSVKGAMFSRDESRVLTWSQDGEVKLWDVTQAEPLQAWQHQGSVKGAVFSRDESRVLSWSDDGVVKLWDVTQAEPLRVWQHPAGGISLMFNRDESRVLSWGGGMLKLWDTSLREPELTVSERITDLQVRSATRLDSAGQLVPLKSAEWIELVRSPEYAAILQKREAAKQKSAQGPAPAGDPESQPTPASDPG